MLSFVLINDFYFFFVYGAWGMGNGYMGRWEDKEMGRWGIIAFNS